MSVRAVLLDAKKTVGAFAVLAPAAVAEGLISGQVAGFIAGGCALATTALVYALDNIPKPGK